jgi:two-component system, NarL family, nitrate/nitrite response regulator NarL
VRKSHPKKIKVLLVDDHPIVLEGIRAHLAAQKDLEVVGDAPDGAQAILKARQLKPDVILMDISMPQMNGMKAISILRRQVPRARGFVLRMHDNREYIRQMVRLGARGYLLKDASPAELVRAIQLVYAGEVYFSPSVSRVLVDEVVNPGQPPAPAPSPANLSEREREVLVHIAEGLTNKDIANQLGLGVRTVETHRERIMRKLGIRSVAGLTKFAIANEMVKL